MRFYQYLEEGKWMTKTMIGLSVDKKPLLPIINHIGKELDKRGIPYNKVDNLHITIAQMPGKHEKDELKRELDKINRPITFRVKDLEDLYGYNVKRHFIVLLLKNNNEFVRIYDDIASRFTINRFPGGLKAHVSLFSIEEKMGFEDKILEEIKEGLPKFPIVKTTHIDLFNNKFQIEYKDKL